MQILEPVLDRAMIKLLWRFLSREDAYTKVFGLSLPQIFVILSWCCVAPTGSASEIPEDPLRSSQWETMYKLYLKGSPVVFDQRVKVLAPKAAENSLEVPVMVDVEALDGVQEVLVFADYNPLPKVLEFSPKGAKPRIGFRLKLQQSSPIRAAARASDGVWHVGGMWVDAAGGGCTLPSVGSASPQWESRLGEVDARLWAREDGSRRLRFSVMHPMDTGLAPGIPAFYAESIELTDTNGELLASIKPYEPVSENPQFALDLPGKTPIIVHGRDNNGNRFNAEIAP